MRIHSSIFSEKSLVVHQFLEGVPLLDVWQIDLNNGGEGRSLHDLFDLVKGRDDVRALSPAVRFLFWLREAMGKVFRWDDSPENQQISPTSYIHKVDDDLSAQSLADPGTLAGPFRVMYQLENEALGEIINATIHAFAHLSFESTPHGYRAFLAVYAIYTKWWSKYYMALIAPFRAWFVYPNLVRTTQRLWQEAYG
ncbi:MAG: DUF2867 domain-containing protein [Chloroflexi bacterium]|nr:DUF2867 domain-containing protein [Chloroflexota bacterium]